MEYRIDGVILLQN